MEDGVSDTDRCERLEAMQAQALLLEQEGDPVLAMNMSRVIAILHETRQLLDPAYLALRPQPSRL